MWHLDFKEKIFPLKEKDYFSHCQNPNEIITPQSGSWTLFKIFHSSYDIAVKKAQIR